MNPQISCILNALDEVKVNLKDNDYKVAVEALATLNIEKEYILTMAKLMPEMEIGSNNDITINVSREMIQSKFNLSDDSVRHLKSLIGSGSICINLTTLPSPQREELDKIKRSIYNIRSKNTVTQTLEFHRRGCPCTLTRDSTDRCRCDPSGGCLTRKKITHCCSSVILLGISLYKPEPDSDEETDENYGASIEFYPNLRLARASLASSRA